MRPTKYVVGFLFCGRHVLLIQKARPAWQVGRLNGVGGHVEPGESVEAAMHREFVEETGLGFPVFWQHFATLNGDDSDANRQAAGSGGAFRVAFFRAYIAGNRQPAVYGQPDEPLFWMPVLDLPFTVLPNLRWLVPMAYYEHKSEWPFLVTENAGAHDL